jgi:hypothetical protein
MVENENIDDNDLVMFVTEMYEVYVDVENMDQVYVVAVVVVVVVGVGINEYYAVVVDDDDDDERVIVFVVEVDNEM